MISKALLASAAVFASLAGPLAAAPLNASPPRGDHELADMADIGTARDPNTLQPTFTLVSLRFIATSNATRFSFAMRADHSNFIDAGGGQHIHGASAFLDDVVFQRVNPITNIVLGGNLVANGDFEGGTDLRDLPNGWIFDQPEGPFVPATGLVTTQTPIPNFNLPPIEGVPPLPNHSFISFSDNKYNALSQTIATIVGATYEIGFIAAFTDNNERNEFGRDTTDYLRLASTDTDGRQIADGLDVILTATDAGHGHHDDGHVHFSALEGGVGVPEPAAWALLIVGFAGVGVSARSRRRAARA